MENGYTQWQNFLGAYYTYNCQMTNGSTVAANPETVKGMLESLGKTSSVHFDLLITCFF